MLWRNWWELVRQLRGACTRSRTFLWMVVCLMGMTVRTDLMGVSSIVRALGLVPSCYGRILDFFHSPALRCPHAALARPGLQTTRRGAPGPAAQYSSERVSGLPQVRQKDTGCQETPSTVRSQHQPQYIFGHSRQAVAVLMRAAQGVFAVPLTCRIHEGIVFSNRERQRLLDKMILLVDSLDMDEAFTFVADAYYASGTIVRGLLGRGNHLVTRVKANAIAFGCPPMPDQRSAQKRGRPKKYGGKIKLASLLRKKSPLRTHRAPFTAKPESRCATVPSISTACASKSICHSSRPCGSSEPSPITSGWPP